MSLVLRAVGWASFLGVLCLAQPARAQDAAALFDQGLADMKAGRYKIGCSLIKRSIELDARAGAIFTLAECYSRGEKYASAIEMYDEYLSLYDKMPPAQKSQQAARAELSKSERTRLLELVSWVTVKLPPSAPRGVVITRDDEGFPASLLDVATAMDPGPHRFTTRVPDGPLVEQRVELASGERREVRLDVRSPSESAAPPPEGLESPEPDATDPGPGTDAKSGASPWVYVSAGIGAAGFVTAAIAGGLLLQKRNVVREECDKDHPLASGAIPCSQKGKDAADLAQGTLAPITEVGLAVGAAGAVATILLLVLDKPKAQSEPRGLEPTATLTTTGGALGVRGAF